MSAPSWIQIEKLCLAYIDNQTEDNCQALDSVLKEAGDFLETVTSFVIRTRAGLEDCSADFVLSSHGQYPDECCSYDAEHKIFHINVVGVMRFAAECDRAKELLTQPEGRGSFSNYRMTAYKTQLSKLPPQMLMFLLLYQEEARILQVTREERRRSSKNEISALDQAYADFLWAFKELEKLYRCIKGVELKSDLAFVWHETEWANGGK